MRQLITHCSGIWSHIPVAAQEEESFPAPELGPCHRELSINFFDMSPSRMQQFSTTSSSVGHCSIVTVPLFHCSVLQAKPGPMWVPPEGPSPTRKPTLVWAHLSTSLQVATRRLLQRRTPIGSQPLSGILFQCLVPLWAVGGCLSPCWPPWAAGACCRGTAGSSWSSPTVPLFKHLNTSSPSFFTDLKSA